MKFKFLKKLLFIGGAGFFSISAISADFLVKEGETAVSEDDVVYAIRQHVPPQAWLLLVQDEKKLRDFIAQLFSTYRMADELAENTLTVEEKWQLYNQQARRKVEIYFQRLKNDIAQADLLAAAREHYAAQPDEFKNPAEAHISQIFISTEKRKKEEALLLTKNIIKQLQKSPDSFADLALKYSDDPSVKDNKGDIGFVIQGKGIAALDQAAFALKKSGELSQPVELDNGYAIIRLEALKPEYETPFVEVKDKLVAQARKDVFRTLVTKEYERIGALPTIEVDQEKMAAFIKNVQNDKRLQPEAGELLQ